MKLSKIAIVGSMTIVAALAAGCAPAHSEDASLNAGTEQAAANDTDGADDTAGVEQDARHFGGGRHGFRHAARGWGHGHRWHGRHFGARRWWHVW
jgi:hypothetical protein